MLCRTLKRVIEKGQTEGMAEKLDIFLAVGKISAKEYKALTKMLNT